jgi:enterochelin esterase-like enzyme
MGKDMAYSVYTPRDFRADERLPLVLFLHGAGDDPRSLDEASVGNLLDQPGVPRVVMLVPQGDRGFWENWFNGKQRYRDWVMRELFPAIQAQFHTLPCPEGCHVMGNSMGGYGALMYSLYEPGRFASVTALSAPVYTTEGVKHVYEDSLLRLVLPIEEIWGPYNPNSVAKRDLYRRWKSAEDLHGARLFLAWGDAEDADMIADNERLHAYLQQQGIPHQALVFHGEHAWKDWAPAILAALRQQVLPTKGETPTKPSP